jgi:type IV pilus assembly protein PilA
MRKQSGFTLIELMIVVAIVGILAAIAIPAYRDYTIRSKVSECAATLGACKTSITEFNDTNAALPVDNTEAGCSTTASQYCTGMAVAAGVATIQVVAATTGTPADCGLTLSPVTDAGGAITAWAGSTGCPVEHVPAIFR